MLRLDNISKLFGGIAALNKVSFAIEKGEILGLIGPNGSGKSTIINVVSGLHRPTSGEVWFKDSRVSNLPSHKVARAGIARTFQLLRLFQGLSVFDNVLAATYLSGSHGLLGAIAGRVVTGREEERLRVAAMHALDFVGLAGRASVPAQQLTAGEGRLLELARAMATGADLFLLDEPAAGLNSVETMILAERLRTLQAQGRTLLLVDHHMQLVMGLATRIIVLDQGRVLAEGSPASIQEDERVIEAYLGRGALKRKGAPHG